MKKDMQFVKDTDKTRHTVRLFWYGGLWRVKSTLIQNDKNASILLGYSDNDYDTFESAYAEYQHLTKG